MDASWLDDFLALAECQNFSRAAERRRLTQPAFSRRIKALEDWVGVPLFNRDTHRIGLTVAGERFHPAAGDVLRRLRQGREEAREAGGADAATLRFAATHVLSQTFFPQWLRGFEDVIPLGAVSLEADNMHGCEQLMLEGRAHFLFCHHHASATSRLDSRHFRSHPVGDDVLVPVSAPAEAGRPRHALPGRDDAPLSFLAYSASSGMGRILAAARAMAGPVAWLAPVFTSHLATVLRTMAREGRGLTWSPLSLVAEDLQCGALVRAGDERWDVPIGIRLFRGGLRRAQRLHLPVDVVAQEVGGIGRDQPLRQRRRLDQEEPPEVPRGEVLVRPRVHGRRRRDVDHGEAGHGGGVVERHAVGDASAAVVAGDGEAVVPERAHQRHLVLRHAALGVGDMALPAVRLAAVAVAAQVGRDHGEALRQRRRDLAPGHVRLGMAVQQEQRRSAAADGGADRDPGRDGHVDEAEAREEGRRPALDERGSLMAYPGSVGLVGHGRSATRVSVGPQLPRAGRSAKSTSAVGQLYLGTRSSGSCKFGNDPYANGLGRPGERPGRHRHDRQRAAIDSWEVRLSCGTESFTFRFC